MYKQTNKHTNKFGVCHHHQPLLFNERGLQQGCIEGTLGDKIKYLLLRSEKKIYFQRTKAGEI